MLVPVSEFLSLPFPAGLAAAQSEEVVTGVVALFTALGTLAACLPRIIRELTIRKVIRHVTKKELEAGEGTQIVSMLTGAGTEAASTPGGAGRSGPDLSGLRLWIRRVLRRWVRR
jgi:hypothetical protein